MIGTDDPSHFHEVQMGRGPPPQAVVEGEGSK
jgi:hypothetical protein